MAQTIISNAYFLINAVDLSDHVQQEDFNQIVEQLEATAMGATTKITKPGLFDGSLKVILFQDYATGKTDQTISPLLGVTTSVEIRASNAARAVTNPAWTFTGSISAYNPIAGKVGDMQMCEVTIELASAVSRLTA
ncbi:MAG TPA: hypothetical protein VNN08_16245 [Thermoanaerobaculia bacterium]|nr:hypothetical protein [Thermoanaerobaculia bacterium]